MAIGHFMMAFEPLFFLALLVPHHRQRRLQAEHLDPGRQSLRAGRSAPRRRLHDLLHGHQPRRVPRNLVCGTLGDDIGWHYGFGAAGVGMIIGLVDLPLRPRSTSPPDNRAKAGGLSRKASSSRSTATNGSASARSSLLVRRSTSLLGRLRAAGQHDAPWADEQDRLAINLRLGRQIPSTWFQSFNPFMIFAFTPSRHLWAWQRAGKRHGAVQRHEDGHRLLRRRRSPS